MKPVRPLRAGAINYNIADAKQLYQNHAKLLTELLHRTDILSNTVAEDSENIEKYNNANHDLFVSLQTEINKLKSSISSISTDVSGVTKSALEKLNTTVTELSARTDRLKESDIALLRKDLDAIKKAFTEASVVKTNVSVLTTNVEALQTDNESFKSSMNEVRGDISTLTDNLEFVNGKVNDINATITTMEEAINKLQQESINKLKQDLLDVIKRSLPTFTPDTVEIDSDSEFETRDIQLTMDYPFDIPQDDPNCDAIEVNGMYLTSTLKNDQQLCSISNSYGGIAIDKENSYDRWVIERNDDQHLNFHFNTEANPPLTINKRGIATSRLRLGDLSINNIVNSFSNGNINNHTVPTTKAIFDFVHANMLQSGFDTTLRPITINASKSDLDTPATIPPLQNNGSTSARTRPSTKFALPTLALAEHKHKRRTSINNTTSTKEIPSLTLEDISSSDHSLLTSSANNGSTSARAHSGIHHQPTVATLNMNKLPPVNPHINSMQSSILNTLPTSPKCDVSTINVGGKHSLLVSNDSCSISLKDSKSLYTLTPSSVDGLTINDQFKLANDDGILCYISSANIPPKSKLSDLKGLFVAYSRNVKLIKSNDDQPNTLYVPEVYLPSSTNSVALGVVTKIINGNYYTKNNRVYSISEHRKDNPNGSDNEDEESDASPSDFKRANNANYYFLVVYTKGIVKVKTKEEKIGCGNIYVPTKGGYVKKITEDAAGQKLNTFCMEHFVPRIKSIKRMDDNLMLGILV